MPDNLPVLGLVGLGEMGYPIARRLLDAGAQLHVFDTNPAAVERAVQGGARAASSPREVADRASTVLLSLPNARIVLDVVGGPHGLIGGSLLESIIDLSTTGPAGAEALREILAGASVAYLDAPVSGGTAGAREGRLSVMAAGDLALLEAMRPVLEAFGNKIFHVGDVPGQGQLTKVLNNLMSASAIVITSEALALGVRNGLDPVRALEAINASSGRNTASADKFPQFVLSRTFDFGFRLALMAKDVSLCVDEAERAGMPMVLGSTVRQLCEVALATLPEGSDSTAVARMIESWAGVTIGGERP